MLPVEEDRKLEPLRDVLGHQAEDALVAVDQQVRASQLREPGDDADGREGREAHQRAQLPLSGAVGVFGVGALGLTVVGAKGAVGGILYPSGGHSCGEC